MTFFAFTIIDAIFSEGKQTPLDECNAYPSTDMLPVGSTGTMFI